MFFKNLSQLSAVEKDTEYGAPRIFLGSSYFDTALGSLTKVA